MRAQKQFHFIYKTTNLLSGKYYIGMHSTDSLEDGYLGSGRRLRYSINKYGKENHIREILEFCKSRNELKSREAEIVNLNEIAKDECINLMIGGQGGFEHISKKQHKLNSSKGGTTYGNRMKSDIPFADRMKKIRSDGIKKTWKLGKLNFSGEQSAFYNKKHSDETKQKIGKANSKYQSGSGNSQYGTCWITNEIINKKIYKGDEIPKGFRLGRVIKQK